VQRKETPEEIALREGMTPAEGVDALDRILGAPFSPQVVACTVDLHAWVNKLSDEARSARGGGVDGAAEGGGPVFSRPNLSAAFVAPRDAMERDLASLWGELLGVADVGVNDDFFELGGQSLIAVRLFHRIGKKYGLELSIATLFQAPTIAQCAALLRERLGLPFGADASSPEIAPANGAPAAAHAEGPFRSMVTIQRGGNLLPFFCVHGAEGNVLNFRDLSRAFDPAQPFYGLQAYGVDGLTPPHGSLEEMARAYLPEIREVQPRGPYLLGGYSGGGVVAYELAQLLTRAGESVALLAFIDSPSPNMSIRRVNRLTRLLGDGFRKRAARIARGGVGYVVEALERKREEARQAARWARDERAIQNYRARGEPIPYELRALHLRLNFERAAPLYKGEPWPGRAILFRAEDVDFLFAEGGPTYGWDRLVLGGVEVVEVPGNHHTVLLGAGAEVLVRSLGRAIATVQNEVAVAPASLRFRSQPPPAAVSSA
jgi:thioesterase domain-containing protein